MSHYNLVAVVGCGRKQSCAELALSRPEARRLYCLLPFSARTMSYSEVPECITGLYYNGAALDIAMKMTDDGITFSFRWGCATGTGSYDWSTLRNCT